MILDSNILIGYLNGDKKIVSALQTWRDAGALLFVSSVSAIEALSLSTLTQTDAREIERFLDDFIIIPVDMRIVSMAGELRRAYRLEVPDAAIAATAAVNNLSLVTRDKKLRSIPGITHTDI